MSSVPPVSSHPKPKLEVSGHDDMVSVAAFFPDGRRVITGSNDGNLRVWDLDNKVEEGASMKHDSTVSGLAVTRDSTKIISIDNNGKIRVWDADSHRVLRGWTHPGSFPSFTVSSSDRLIAVGYENTVFYTVGGQVYRFIEIGSRVSSMRFSPDGNKLACGTGYDVRVYDVENGTLLLGPLKGHKDWVRGVVWSVDGSKVFSTGFDRTIRCWNTATGRPVGRPWVGHTDWIVSLSMSSDGATLASVSNDRTVRLWDTLSGAPIGQHLQHEKEVNAVCFSLSGESVLSVGWRGVMCIWQVPSSDSANGQPLDVPEPDATEPDAQPSTISSPPSSVQTQPLNNDIGRTNHPVKSTVTTNSYLVPATRGIIPRGKDSRDLDLRAAFPSPPPDLTPHIVKADSEYVAGGGFGDVYRCWYHDGPPKQVAVKAFRFTFATDRESGNRSAKMLRRELGIWRRLDHANIVPFLGVAYGFGMHGAMSLVSLWMPNESLHIFLENHDRNLDLGHRLHFLMDIATGLHYLHSFPIVHGDLNCHNVLLDADYTARLTDFGYASLVGSLPEALTYLQRSTTRPGALRWSAPEQVQSEGTFVRTPKSDIYSFGCVLFQVLSGRQPWSEIQEDAAVVLRIARGHKPGRPVSRAMDDSHWHLIRECWSEVEERPPADVMISVIQHFLDHCPSARPLHELIASWSASDIDRPRTLVGTHSYQNQSNSESWRIDHVRDDS